MKIKEIKLNTHEITADEGKKLTDGNGYYRKVFLSNLDNVDNYTEINETDIPKEIEEENEKEENAENETN